MNRKVRSCFWLRNISSVVFNSRSSMPVVGAFEEAMEHYNVLSGMLEEANRELAVYKGALAAVRAQKTEVSRLGQGAKGGLAGLQVSLHYHLPLGTTNDWHWFTQGPESWTVVVIDGNDCMFTSDYLRARNIGGELVATKLNHFLRSPLGQKSQFYLTVFVNRASVSESLIDEGIISHPSEFDEFVSGFNQVSPLLTIVDVGNSNETIKVKMEGKSFDALS